MSDPREPAVQQALTRLAELAASPSTGVAELAQPHAIEAAKALLVPLLSASPYLTRFLLAHPEALAEVRELPAARDKAAWLSFLAQRAPLSDAELNAYLASMEWQGKAGGYAIQGAAGAFIPWISGSFTGIVGLPLAETATLLQAAGFPVWNRP